MSKAVLITTARVTDPDAICLCEHALTGHEVAPGTDRRFIVPCSVDGCECVEYRDRRAPAR
jgi:hypothetical protein